MKRVYANAGLGILCLVILLGTPVTARAQAPSEANEERTYGIQDPTTHTLSAWAFRSFNGTDPSLGTAKFARYCSTPCSLLAPLILPQGALLTRLVLDACDTNPGGAVTALVLRKPEFDGDVVQLGADVSTTTGGCGRFSIGFNSLVPAIDNTNNSYFIQVGISGTDSNTRFAAVRVLYHLQVSPAPAVATFNDVPTNHLFFQFIEALAAAGITGGCSTTPPLYCPDDPVTRGQMAVFISRALGLHFPL